MIKLGANGKFKSTTNFAVELKLSAAIGVFGGEEARSHQQTCAQRDALPPPLRQKQRDTVIWSCTYTRIRMYGVVGAFDRLNNLKPIGLIEN